MNNTITALICASAMAACAPTEIQDFEVGCDNGITKVENAIVESTSDALAYSNPCFRVTETLRISGTDLTDLTFLSGLKEVNNIEIKENPDLESFDGLINVKVTGDIIIHRNPRLLAIENLEPAPTLKGEIRIQSNDALDTIIDFESLTTVNESLQIVDNTSLPDLDAFGKVATIKGDLRIEDNSGLREIAGFGSLRGTDGSLVIHNNSSLTKIDGFSSPLATIGGDLQVTDNRALTDATGLSFYLDQVIGSMTVTGNSALSECRVDEFDAIDAPVFFDGDNGISYDPCY